jgi:hypothetical protein
MDTVQYHHLEALNVGGCKVGDVTLRGLLHLSCTQRQRLFEQ